VKTVAATGALASTREVAKSQADLAKVYLDALPATPYKDALIELAALSVGRTT
jgi:octaprenyl-diphosphate synthase